MANRVKRGKEEGEGKGRKKEERRESGVREEEGFPS